MKKIKLISLTLRNFKGITNFMLQANGENVEVYGDNATGKTTIADAFMWLMFDKDSTNKKDFNIKTLDQEGNVIHGLEHEVEGVIVVNDVKVTLKKIYKEKWTKKRGEASKELTGHSTEYMIDEVPKKKKDYNTYIESLADEKIFKLSTNPLFFNTEIDWKKRRTVLIDICGGIADSEVFSKSNELNQLSSLLHDKEIEDFRKSVQASKRKLNEKIKEIPARIDEVNRSIPVIEDINLDSLQVEKVSLEGQIYKIEQNIAAINNVNAEYNKKVNAIAQKKRQLNELKLEIERDCLKGKNDLITKKRLLEDAIHEKEQSIQRYKNRSKLLSDTIKSTENEMSSLREKWTEINEQTIQIDSNNFICPTCKQTLPEEQKEEKIQELTTNFNIAKKVRLDNISNQGVRLKNDVERLNKEIENHIQKIETTKSEIEVHEESINDLDNQINNFTVDIDSATEGNDKYISLRTEIDEMEIELRKPIGVNERVLGEKKIFQQRINEINNILAQKDRVINSNKRIEVLKDEEREMANKIAELEGQEYLAEQFIRTKVNLLEEKINDKFKLARFKMFNTLINGGLEECCETLYNGVPYTDLNNAMKINIGLDIINTLSNYYGVQAPIIIDNKESVNKIIDTESQIISLIVSYDKQLRIENKLESEE